MRSETPVNQWEFSAYQVSLQPIAQVHQMQMRAWRNQPEIRQQMLDTALISEEQQLAWFKKASYDPKQLHWIVQFRDRLIGVTNVKSLEMGKSAAQASVLEPGLYIGDHTYQNNIIAFAPSLAMYDFCFAHFSVQQFRAVVKSSNTQAMKYNEKLGYQIISQGDVCVLELNYNQYTEQTVILRQLLSRERKATNVKR